MDIINNSTLLHEIHKSNNYNYDFEYITLFVSDSNQLTELNKALEAGWRVSSSTADYRGGVWYNLNRSLI